MGIGANNPTTPSPFIVPSMSAAEIAALTAVNGMLMYNTTNNVLTAYIDGAWKILAMVP